MKNPYSVIKDFEDAVADYTGAPYCVALNSCTNALFLCLMYMKLKEFNEHELYKADASIEIPNHTYVGVPMSIKHAGFGLKFREENWKGVYQLKPYYIYDAARRFTSHMCDEIYYNNDMDATDSKYFICTSHHYTKILDIQHGGCILHNSADADAWLRRARFDGRTGGLSPNQDDFRMLGWHMPMPPEIAAAGLVRLAALPEYNEDLPNSNYPDLSKMEIFK